LKNHLFKYIDNPCEDCGKIKLNLSNSNIDHILPISSSITIEDVLLLNQLSNLRLICIECNSRKISSDLKYIKKVKGN